MSCAGFKYGWFYDCSGERTYPASPTWDRVMDDTDRLEFLMQGWKVSSTGKEFFIHPLTGYFKTRREAVDCAIDIVSQREWRCYEEGCLEKGTHLITGGYNTFKKCAEHMEVYRSPEARDQWKIEELT